MKKWKVHVILDEEYDDIEAETEEEAFEIASDFAMQGGSWEYTAFPILRKKVTRSEIVN